MRRRMEDEKNVRRQPNTTIKEARGWVFSCLVCVWCVWIVFYCVLLDCSFLVVWIDSCTGSTKSGG